MAKKKKRTWVFPLCMAVYAVIFLALTGFGLNQFWAYMEAYEASRPEVALNGYMQKVDAEYICNGGASAVLEDIDLRVQSEEVCLDYIRNTLTEPISCAKNRKESNDNHLVYMILCGKQTVGKITLTPQAADKYGFTPWQVTEECFDLSYIKSNTATITVPSGYWVSIDGVLLDDSYITETNIPFAVLEGYYEDYTPPYMVTYRSGAYLGEPKFEVANRDGQSVTIDENTDLESLISNCTAEESEQLTSLVESFVGSYVDFTSCADNDLMGHYNRLAALLVPDCELKTRLYGAIAGLSWTSDRHSEITALEIHHRVNLGNDRYLCDVTYEVDTQLHNGTSHEVTKVHFLITNTDNGMRVEGMEIR